MDEFNATILSLISILLLSIFLYNNIIAFRKSQSPPLPPGPRGLPIVGYLPFLRPSLHRQLSTLARKYGPIFKLQLGSKLCIVIDSPSLTKEVVRDHDTIFANRDVTVAANLFSYGGNDIAWSANNSSWRSMRKLFVREMLSASSLDASCNLRTDEVSKAIKSIYRRIGTPIEIGDMIMLTELNVIMNLLWGGTVEEGGEGERVRMELRKLIPEVVDFTAKPNVSDLFPVLAWLDIQGVKKQMESKMKSIDLILDSVIAKHSEMLAREENQEGRKDFLRFLLEQKEFSLSERQLKGILVNVIGGGTDTTSTTIEWTMAELLNNPKVMNKVQKELSDVVGMNNKVEEFHFPKLQYLLAVIKETMRLHPAGPLLIPRSPSQSVVVGGYTVPKDTKVLINVWSMQTNPSTWDNPREFKPERFITDAVKLDFNGNNCSYLPFGSGRRGCAGIPLAERMTIFLLASLLHSFDWKLPEGYKLDMEDTLLIVLRKRTPLIAIPSPRLSNFKLYV